MKIDLVSFVLNALDDWKRLTDGLERTLVDNIAATVPWLAPVIPAYMIYGHAVNVFDWPGEMALVTALVIWGVGQAVVSTAYQLWEYGQTNGMGEVKASFLAALITTGHYLLVVIVVNVLLDLFPDQMRILSQALLSTLAEAAMVTLALRSQHARRLDAKQRVQAADEKKNDRAENRRMRQELKLAEIDAAARANVLRVPETTGDLPKVAPSMPETFGKWEKWPDVPDEYKLQVANAIREAKKVNSKTYKKVVSKWIVETFGTEERSSYAWINYAERDFPTEVVDDQTA